MIDRYTKIVLTVITAALVLLGMRSWLEPRRVVAQETPCEGPTNACYVKTLTPPCGSPKDPCYVTTLIPIEVRVER